MLPKLEGGLVLSEASVEAQHVKPRIHETVTLHDYPKVSKTDFKDRWPCS